MRWEAAKSFEAGAGTARVAAELRVTDRSVRRWRAAWRRGQRPSCRTSENTTGRAVCPGQTARGACRGAGRPSPG
ncbi:helix-turn-helix domain-containing protein [Streptomyces sp. NPDC002328]|uniref:helix-turn-helix domain-containing protein n=1 Tax=Streptomyces sp. NPDC002328 TaxID=3364642 RepID=UPI00369A02CE